MAAENEATEITPDARVRRAFGQMPYGGIAHFRWPKAGEPMTMEIVAENLEALVVTLERVSDEDRRRDAELEDHRVAVRGFGRLLNLARDANS